MKEKFSWAAGVIQEAGELIKQNLSLYSVNTKSNAKDLVTDIDIMVEEFFCQRIKQEHPADFILAEECTVAEEVRTDKNLWVLDPIDGTVNFIHQQQNFAISLAYYENTCGVFGIVYDVIKGDLYSCYKGQGAYLNAVKLLPLQDKKISESLVGLSHKWLLGNQFDNYLKALAAFRNYRYYGVASLEICYLAQGLIDIYLSGNLKPWDYAAAKIIIEELGGCIKGLQGEALTGLEFTALIAGERSVVDKFFELCR